MKIKILHLRLQPEEAERIIQWIPWKLTWKWEDVILDAFPEMKVDVHNPDIVINIEIRNKINIYSKIILGPGGMPVGTAGNGMLLLSGGIDSPVAGYMVAKTWSAY